MHIKTYLLVVLLLIQYPLLAQSTLTEAAPASAGMSAQHLQLLDSLVTHYVNQGWMPGGVFLIARQGKIVYYKSFGYRTVQKKDAYQKEDIFRIASMTKAITTVSIMQLYEQGKLGLDDSVAHYIPAFEGQTVLDTYNEADSSFTTVPAESPVTIRQLLTHTSGITYGSSDQENVRVAYEKYGMTEVGLSHPEWTTEEFINRLAEVPLVFQPGEKYMYGLNMDVLGRVIEVVSGMSLRDYFHQHIFAPLDMQDTYFYLPKEKHNRLVPVYTQTSGREITMAENSRVNYPTNTNHTHYAGGGGLSSTAMDYARFIQALVNGGTYNGYKLLGRKTLEVMTADQMITLNEQGNGFSQLPGLTYGLGFSLLTEEGRGINAKSPGTYEWGGYFNTKFFIDPKEQLIFVGMTQIVPFSHQEFWDRVYTIIYGAIDD